MLTIVKAITHRRARTLHHLEGAVVLAVLVELGENGDEDVHHQQPHHQHVHEKEQLAPNGRHLVDGLQRRQAVVFHNSCRLRKWASEPPQVFCQPSLVPAIQNGLTGKDTL